MHVTRYWRVASRYELLYICSIHEEFNFKIIILKEIPRTHQRNISVTNSRVTPRNGTIANPINESTTYRLNVPQFLDNATTVGCRFCDQPHALACAHTIHTHTQGIHWKRASTIHEAVDMAASMELKHTWIDACTAAAAATHMWPHATFNWREWYTEPAVCARALCVLSGVLSIRRVCVYAAIAFLSNNTSPTGCVSARCACSESAGRFDELNWRCESARTQRLCPDTYSPHQFVFGLAVRRFARRSLAL